MTSTSCCTSSNLFGLPLPRWFVCAVVPFAAALCLGVYILSIVMRVSIAEHCCFGRSMLMPVSLDYPRFVEPAVDRSYGEKTYRWQANGRDIRVWKQKINGFQHMYGSALASFEMGELAADKLFCANEFAEAYCDWNGIQADDLFDRRKDLWINQLGRAIGSKARSLGLTGRNAGLYLQRECFDTVENSPEFIPHWLDARVVHLNEARLGCPFLPKRNFANRLQKLAAMLTAAGT